MRKLSLIISTAFLLCAVPLFAGTEEVSLYSMTTWSNEYKESIGWNASYNPATKTISYEGEWKQIGWNMHWKWIDASTTEFSVEFAEATTAGMEIYIRYVDNNERKTKQFDFGSGVTSATCDLLSGFEDSDDSNSFQILYISIKYGTTSLRLNRAWFTTTKSCDLYQAENAEYFGYVERFTEEDNAVIKIEDKTGDDNHVTFTVDVPYRAVYRLNIGYNNGTSNNDRACNLSINGGSDNAITLPKTGEEHNKNIGEVAYSTLLNKGTNTITIHGNWRWYNIDYLRVYMPDMYLIGNQHGTLYEWKYANDGGHMTFDSQTETFSITTRIGTNDNQKDPGTFAFATTIADNEDLGGQAYVNGHRWGPETDNLIPNTNGTTATTDIQKRSDHAYRVPMAGTYTITVKADLSSFTIQGPEVYMFGLFQGSNYTWGTNNFQMMQYDAENAVYRLRTHIAEAAASTDNGEVAFATAYSEDTNWDYLNANRYGPETTGTPSVDGTTNEIGLHNTAFNYIPAAKYEVVVDMFSAPKTAQFYPLYTFGYEVVGTHGSIVCSTTPGEIPRGSVVTVTATPDAGYRFVKWTDGSDQQLSTSATYSHTISANTWLKAWFEPDPSCKLTIPANTFAFAKHNYDDIYPAVDNSFLHEATGAVYFDYTLNSDGAELYYSVHLDAGTYFFYCTLSGDGTERKMRLYAQNDEGTLLYSGKKWSLSDSHDFGTGAATFETKGFTVTTGDYLIALYAKANTKFSQIDVVGVCNGASANTNALTLSADANGSVISDQINNARIVSGTNILLLAEPASGYRFEKWSDNNTDNPRSVTMSSNVSLTASFANASSGCLNTRTIQCATDSISPTTRPIASPKSTSVSGTILTNQEEEKSIYYAFEITEPKTCTITLLTPRSDKRQKIYLYSAQLESGTSLTYSGDTYYQVQDPTDANTSNSGTNHVYPVCSTTLELAAGKYVIGLYSEGSWSQYDRIVFSAGADNIDCSNADITIYAGEQVELPHAVRNLTVHQGGVATNSHDVNILNSVTYIRPAFGGAHNNLMNHWYTFCLPFTPSSCKVYDEADGRDYEIGAIYLREGNSPDNPTGTGYFYLEYLKEENLSALGNEFRTRWAYIAQPLPQAYVPYIIMFVNYWEDTNTDDYYFEQNPTVKFIGGPQKIDGQAKIDNIADEGVEKYYYYANNTLSPIHLSSAYVYDPARNNFDYQEDVTIPPFECYIQATESYKARHKTIAMPRQPGKEDTTTGISGAMDEDGQIEVYDCMGHRVVLIDNRLPAGIWIVKQGANVRKIVVH